MRKENIRNMICRQVKMSPWENYLFCKYSFRWKYHTFLSDKNQCRSQNIPWSCVHDLCSWSPPKAVQLVTAFVGRLQRTFLSTGVVNLSSNPPRNLLYIIPKLISSCYSHVLLFPLLMLDYKNPSSCCKSIIDLKYIQLNTRLFYC
jgi:hypothetical protein